MLKLWDIRGDESQLVSERLNAAKRLLEDAEHRAAAVIKARDVAQRWYTKLAHQAGIETTARNVAEGMTMDDMMKLLERLQNNNGG